MRYKGLSFLLAGLILISIISSYISSIICVASELKEEVEVIQDQIEDHIEIIDDQVEDQQEEEDILTDSYVELGSLEDQEEDKRIFFKESTRLLSASSTVNVYDSTVSWLFDQTYFFSYGWTSGMKSYYFKPDQFDNVDQTNSLLSDFKANSGISFNTDNEFTLDDGTVLRVLSTRRWSDGDIVRYRQYFNQNVGMDKLNSCYWENPDATTITPTPTYEPTPTEEPTPTITPIPTDEPTPTVWPTPSVTPTPTGVPEDMPDNNIDTYRVMVIFCFGLVAGVVVGHYLTGFIK